MHTYKTKEGWYFTPRPGDRFQATNNQSQTWTYGFVADLDGPGYSIRLMNLDTNIGLCVEAAWFAERRITPKNARNEHRVCPRCRHSYTWAPARDEIMPCPKCQG